MAGLNINRNVQEINKVAEVKEFLNENYKIRVNEFDPSKSEIKAKTKVFDNPITFDDISLHALEDGVQVSDNVLRKILRSPNQIQTFNPISEYFDSMKGKYKGVSHIDLLMSHLSVRSYPGKSKDFYRERLYKYMKKWFVATAACALGVLPNDVSLGLVHADEGIGKSFFFKFIIPHCLRSLVADPKEDGKFNLESSFATNFVVYFDELHGINKRNTEEFKKVMSAIEIDVYLPREPYPIRRNRIASACFSSNKSPELGGFLTSAMGTRRWLIIELDDINQEYSKKVDVDQLWAEALLLMEQDFDYQWNQSEWKEFAEHNTRYYEETPSMRYVKTHLDYPVNGEGQWMQPKEILNHLITNKIIRREDIQKVNSVMIGNALNTLSFEQKKVRKSDGPRKRYYVNFIN